MKVLNCDVAVIGAGTAGLNARREVERRGGRPIMIERGAFGTTCARVGCMPSKLLIAAAEAAHGFTHAPMFGVHPVQPPRIDGPAVMARVQRERDRFVRFGVEDVEALPPGQVLRGHAKFVGPTRLVVDGEVQVDARAVVVATGSHPFVPPPFDAIRDRVLTSDEVFELPDVPKSLAVIGTGIIALELGQAMARLGARVAFFNPFDELGPFTDPEVQRVAHAVMGADLTLNIGIEMQAPVVDADGIRLRWTSRDGAAHEEHFARVLVARPTMSTIRPARFCCKRDSLRSASMRRCLTGCRWPPTNCRARIRPCRRSSTSIGKMTR